MTEGHARKRIGLVSAWASRLGGGVFEAVVAHAELLAALGHEPIVFALEDEHSPQDIARFGDIETRTFPIAGPDMVKFSPGLAPAMREANLDLLHLHGIWLYPSRAASIWARSGKPYMISPHGMLDPWILARGRWKKAIAKIGYERDSWQRARCFHALTSAEAADIADATGRTECVVVPNAVGLSTGTSERGPIVAYLGRIHPKKNVEGLIAGWRLARDFLEPIGARLHIAGWGETEHVDALRTLIAADGKDDVVFLGPAFGEAKAELLGSARFLALPSHSEGLPMAILEAWAAGTPTLMSQHCHLPEGYAAGAGIDCGTDPEAIATSLKAAFARDAAGWQAMSQAATDLIRTRFSPDVVAQQWRELIDRLTDGPAMARA